MQQVSDWLEKLGLGQYAQRFAENDISFSILPDLTDQDLKELGVASLGHRRQLLREIGQLGKTVDAPQSTPSPSALPSAPPTFAPPAAPLRVSDPQPAQNYVVIEVDAKWGGAVPHPSPARMMAFCLSGCTRQTASSGESHTFVAGDCLLHDDTSGKGHSTEVISDVPAQWVFIRLPS